MKTTDPEALVHEAAAAVPCVAAIYTRRSRPQPGIAEAATLVARQEAACRAYAAAQGWAVDEGAVYSDAHVSGAEFAKRPGLVALLNALTPPVPFQVLLLYDADRLGPEQFETAYVLKQLHQAGVTVYETKAGGRALALDSPLDKMVMSVLAGAAEIERAKARERTRAALQAKAERGACVGGAVFGYRNVEVRTPDGKRSHVERAVVPEERRPSGAASSSTRRASASRPRPWPSTPRACPRRTPGAPRSAAGRRPPCATCSTAGSTSANRSGAGDGSAMRGARRGGKRHDPTPSGRATATSGCGS